MKHLRLYKKKCILPKNLWSASLSVTSVHVEGVFCYTGCGFKATLWLNMWNQIWLGNSDNLCNSKISTNIVQIANDSQKKMFQIQWLNSSLSLTYVMCTCISLSERNLIDFSRLKLALGTKNYHLYSQWLLIVEMLKYCTVSWYVTILWDSIGYKYHK